MLQGSTSSTLGVGILGPGAAPSHSEGYLSRLSHALTSLRRLHERLNEFCAVIEGVPQSTAAKQSGAPSFGIGALISDIQQAADDCDALMDRIQSQF